jgi:ATP-dependent DNA helicase RecQ
MDSARAILKERFGFDDFLPGQETVISHLLSSRSSAAIFPTGSGKSLCYQLPALMLDGLTLVVSPLIALMKDQLDDLKRRGVSAARLDSSLGADEYRTVTASLRKGELKLLYAAPERFNNERFRRILDQVKVSLFAVDEAHCVSEWGHNFRPDYLKLAKWARVCGAERTLALTATATPKVIDDICKTFDIAPDCVVNTGFYRSNLTVLATPITGATRDCALVDQLRDNPPGPTIVYVTRQRTAEEVSDILAKAGFSSKPYHAGMKNEERAAVQDWFMESDCAAVVATIAFGMGIDKANIRYVYHYNLPKSLENFAQEIGRAGRDGQPAVCRMFVCPDDLLALENFAFGDTPSRRSIEGLVDELFSTGQEFSVSHFTLSSTHDIKILVVKTLLTYLELDGWLRAGTPFYSVYRFRPLVTSKEILDRFEGERRSFLQKLFSHAVRAKIWFDLDLDDTAEKIGADRTRIVAALDYLAEQQLLELSAEGLRNAYTRLKEPISRDDLVESLYQKTLKRESFEIERLHQVMEFATSDKCLVSKLNAHFGAPLNAPCGHCSLCLFEPRIDTIERTPAPIDEALLDDAIAFATAHPDIFSEPRAVARFLVGAATPKTGRAKLSSDKRFGAFLNVPFATLLDEITRRQQQRRSGL